MFLRFSSGFGNFINSFWDNSDNLTLEILGEGAELLFPLQDTGLKISPWQMVDMIGAPSTSDVNAKLDYCQHNSQSSVCSGLEVDTCCQRVDEMWAELGDYLDVLLLSSVQQPYKMLVP